MKKLLIVDDEPHILQLISKYASYEGYDVNCASNGVEALKMCAQKSYDLIVMDIMMPELDGFATSREIRKTSDTPILLLSAKGEESDRINGFEAGADDYVVKPFSPKELMLRIAAIIKRNENIPPQSSSDIFKIGSFVADPVSRIVKIDDERITLSRKEYDLLFYMIKNVGIALTRDMLICEVWGYDFDGDDRTLDTHIKLLRRSLGKYGTLITTLRGVGYRFESEIR
ncbi:MAG: response regulator transcription factor [Clostridia bacterium]|nr:response regulator transcription factor [Clostridia bacterium]